MVIGVWRKIKRGPENRHISDEKSEHCHSRIVRVKCGEGEKLEKQGMECDTYNYICIYSMYANYSRN